MWEIAAKALKLLPDGTHPITIAIVFAILLLTGAVIYYVKRRHDALKNVPGRTIQVTEAPDESGWDYVNVPYVLNCKARIKYVFYLTNVTNDTIISIPNATVIYNKVEKARPVKITYTDPKAQEPQEIDELLPGKRYKGTIEVYIEPPHEPLQVLSIKVIIRDQYNRRHKVKEKIRRRISHILTSDPPTLHAKGDGTITERKRLFGGVTRRVSGTIIFGNQPEPMSVARLLFNAAISSCSPRVCIDGKAGDIFYMIQPRTTAELRFNVDASRVGLPTSDSITTDIHVVDTFGRIFMLRGMRFVRPAGSVPEPFFRIRC